MCNARADTPNVPTTESNRRPWAASPPGRDAGFTLPEIAIAIVLMAILVVPLLQAVSTTITASSRSRSAAQVETAVVNASDRVNRAPKSCDYTEYVRAAVQSQGWLGESASIVQERYVPPTQLQEQGAWLDGACDSGQTDPPDLLVQRVTITITSPDGKASRTIQVVKSDV